MIDHNRILKTNIDIFKPLLTIINQMSIIEDKRRAAMREDENEYVTATEAMRLLDVSKGKMAKLIKTGEMPYISDPRNERAKLIKRADINAWLAKTVRPKVPHRSHTPLVESSSSPSEAYITAPSKKRVVPGPDDTDSSGEEEGLIR
jgi:excisionase family DNA binding protein